MSKRRYLVKALIVYTLVVCTGFLFAYAEFRACGGDAFSAVVVSLPGIRGSRWSRPPTMTWQQSVRWGAADDEVAALMLTLSYGRRSNVLPDSPQSWADPSGRVWYTRRVTAEGSRFTLCIDVNTTLSEQAFESRYPGLLAGIVREVKSPPRLSLFRTLYTRVALIPTLAVNVYTIFPGGAIASGLNDLVAVIAGLPGWLILPLLILAPSRLVLPVFWMLVIFGILYVLLPQRAWGWIKDKAKLSWKRIFASKS